MTSAKTDHLGNIRNCPLIYSVVHSFESVDGMNSPAIRRYHDAFHKLPPASAFALNKENGDSRSDLFVKTIKVFALGGATAGVGIADGAMLVPDLLVGRGPKQEDLGHNMSLEGNGVLGAAAKVALSGAGALAELAGSGAGLVLGGVIAPLGYAVKPKKEDWFTDAINVCRCAASRIVTDPAGLATSAALNIVRATSVAVKCVSGVALAVVGGAVGVLAGGIRAALNI